MFFEKQEGGVAVERLLPGPEPAECCKGGCAHRKEDRRCPKRVPALRRL